MIYLDSSVALAHLLGELQAYDPLLLEKPRRIVLNKIDLLPNGTVDLRDHPFAEYAISAMTGRAIEPVLQSLDGLLLPPLGTSARQTV